MAVSKSAAYKRYRAHQRRKNKKSDYFAESVWSGARFTVAVVVLFMLIMVGHVTEGSGKCKWSGCEKERISADVLYCSEHYHYNTNR